MKFSSTRLAIPDLVLIEHEMFKDARGFFVESYKERDFSAFGIPHFVQDNHSRSMKGILRGLHYQKEPASIGKLVRCLRGHIFDVAIDMRKGSPHFGKWVGVDLTEENNKMLYVPPGFAHGFCVLSDIADVFYKMTGYYSQEHDRGIVWNDPDLGIHWPIQSPSVSSKDANAPRLRDADNNFLYGS
ncbi:dTDP-4-dehydrorhamnose 3,5-epimerase [Candidatus Nitrospira bockiana]